MRVAANNTQTAAGVKHCEQRSELTGGVVALTLVCHVEDDNDAMRASVVGADHSIRGLVF
jgi:hypothetical protein